MLGSLLRSGVGARRGYPPTEGRSRSEALARCARGSSGARAGRWSKNIFDGSRGSGIGALMCVSALFYWGFARSSIEELKIANFD